MSTKPTSTTEESDDIQMTAQELHILSELDSRQFGFLLLSQPENASKKALVQKAVKYLQLMVVQAKRQQKLKESNENGQSKNISIDPKTWAKLGHFHLLLEDYRKALSAYQMFYKTQADNHWLDTSFLYGIGLVYFHYNAFQFAIKAFQQLLYVSPGFQRANEVNLRLGLMFKVMQEHDLSLKHLQLALLDNNPCTASKNMIKFHIAHLFEVQGKVKLAKDRYDELIKDETITQSLRADILRQLGWLYHCQESLGDKTHRISLAIHCLQKANSEADQVSGQTLYLLGRCYANIGKVHDAFIAYRGSVEKSEGNADTWCSIGVLYQQQNQPMDALQAYICAVQLDKTHSAAWANLGILYENSLQARDAYACYLNSSRGMFETAGEEAPAKLPPISSLKMGMNPQLAQRISFLHTHLSNAPMPSVTSQRRQLLSIEEAWNLPISAEMSSRQQNSSQPSRPIPAQSFQKNYPAPTPQGPPPPYPNESAAKRFKMDPDQKPVVQPTYGLSPQHLQLLNHFQQNASSLNPAQQSLMHHLQQQYRLMQQNQDIKRNAAPRPVVPSTFPNNPGYSLAGLNTLKTEKLVQPNSLVEPKEFMNPVESQSADMDENLEEDLKDLLAQKDLATTLAENILKHFGTQEMDVKDSSGGNTLSSGPFSPSNIDRKPNISNDKMCNT